jgi:hypothetical protein
MTSIRAGEFEVQDGRPQTQEEISRDLAEVWTQLVCYLFRFELIFVVAEQL